jgi:hypothetical protein
MLRQIGWTMRVLGDMIAVALLIGWMHQRATKLRDGVAASASFSDWRGAGNGPADQAGQLPMRHQGARARRSGLFCVHFPGPLSVSNSYGLRLTLSASSPRSSSMFDAKRSAFLHRMAFGSSRRRANTRQVSAKCSLK